MRVRRDTWTWALAGLVSGLAAMAACAPETTDGSASGGRGGTAGGDTTEAGDPDAAADDASGGSDGGDDVVQGAADYCGYSAQIFNATLAKTSKVAWTCTASTRSLASNGIPDHAPGTFPNPHCPNTIAELTITASLPYVPSLTGNAAPIVPTGYAVNGVKYDPGTAGTCTVSNGVTTCSLAGGGGQWRIEALGQSTFDFGVDSSNAHVQPTGEYHYHGMPNGLLTRLGKGQAMTLVGFAMDGVPIYARYGYSVANDETSPLKVLTGSWQVKAAPDPGRPSSSTYPMGTFQQDYEYVQGLGDLDQCNGRTGVTPEFPNGTYYYAITDTYPYIGRCVKGTRGTSTTSGGSGGGGMPPPPP